MITTPGMFLGFSIIAAITIVGTIMMLGHVLKDLRERQGWVWLAGLIIIVAIFRAFDLFQLPATLGGGLVN